MGRRDPPSAPSSSRRENGSDHRHRSVGCMAGIFQFFSRHHHHSRKRLTSAKKKEKTVIVISPSKTSLQPEKPAPAPPFEPWPVRHDGAKTQQPRRRSSEDPRSPSIPAEIRRRSTESIESPRLALLPRLMGLEDAAPPQQTASAAGTPWSTAESSAADKRRRLLGALEKCDEDLKTLKRIIDGFREAEVKTKAVVSAGEPPPATAERTGSAKIKAALAGFEMDGGDLKAELGNGELPSPVSVLDAISSPRYRSKRIDSGEPNGNEIIGVGSKIVKPSRMGVVFTGEKVIELETKTSNDRENYRSGSRRKSEAIDAGLPRVTEPTSTMICRRLEESCRWIQRWRKEIGSTTSSRAMVESVGEVWEDGLWEEMSEVGRVGAAVAGGILWDLVEEMVLEMNISSPWCSSASSRVSLPMRRCRKRLLF